jgi:hypothetical protein
VKHALWFSELLGHWPTRISPFPGCIPIFHPWRSRSEASRHEFDLLEAIRAQERNR